MADFIDKINKSVASHERALGDGAPAVPDFSAMLTQQQPQGRNWSQMLGQGPQGISWGGMGQRQGGIDWGATLGSGSGLGLNWNGMANGAGGSAFDRYKQLVGERKYNEEAKKQAEIAQGQKVTERGTGATGADPNTDKWRSIIDQAASQYGIDGDAIQAVMMIESSGNPQAKSVAGATGLMQVMPFHFQAGEDPFDPKTNVFKGASILADNYKRYGSWDKAVAAYLGAIDANGNITTAQDANGTDGFKYAALFNTYYQRIKQARAKQQPQGGAPYAGGTGGASSIWGGQNAKVTQEYGVVTPGIDQGIYGYGAEYGLPQGHTGWDVGVARGTQLYMPAGLSGVVEIAGGTNFFGDDDYASKGTPGRGELRIRLSNGDILILGHTSQIGVQVGQQVTGGQAVALSGSASGDHLHLEVRQRQPDGSYRLVNPGVYFGQQATGGSGGNRY